MAGSLHFEAPTALQYFAALVADDASFPVLEVAVAVAQDDDPTLDAQGVLAHVDALADRLKKRIPADAAPLQRLRLVNQYFFEELGFAGNVNEVVIVNNTIIGHEYYFKVYHNGQGVLSGGNIFAAAAHVPTTQLIATDCGRTGLIPTSVIRSAWPVNQFLLSNWMFKFQEMSPPFNVYEVISPNGNNPNFRLNWFPQLQAGRTYAVWTRPKMYQGPTWGDYGTSCLITMAPLQAGMIAYDDDETSTSEDYRFGVENMILDVWPNPAQDEVMIRFNASEGDAYADIRIVDVSGKEVDHIYRTFEGGEMQTMAYTTENLTTGIYLIHVRTASGSTVAKLAVNH